MLTIKLAAPDKAPRYLGGGRRRANSSVNSRAASPRPSTGGHNRASSEFSTTFRNQVPDAGSTRTALGTVAIHSSGTPGSSVLLSSRLSSDCEKLPDTTGAESQLSFGVPSGPPFLELISTSPFSMQQPGRTSSQSSLPSGSSSDRARQSYVETDDDSAGFKDPDDIPILEREEEMEDLHEEEKPAHSRGMTWDELVDRLLSQPMSRADNDFSTIFLCFYRKFAAPRDLLSAILHRYDRLCGDDSLRYHCLTTQVRYCSILHQWVTTHPGDFAHRKTKKRLSLFVDSIIKHRTLYLLAQDMSRVLQGDTEDEDDAWGTSDMNVERRDSLQSFLTASTTFPESSVTEDGWNLTLDGSNSLQVPGSELGSSKRQPDAAAPAAGSAVAVKPDSSSVSPMDKLVLSQFELFMSIPVEEVTDELTRIDWDDFSKIRPRDLVRHISVPPESRDNARNLAAVNKMISHFNHVAYWVASVILEKPKPKHRARALEKFMEIAWVYPFSPSRAIKANIRCRLYGIRTITTPLVP
jgi:hypothetical protein